MTPHGLYLLVLIVQTCAVYGQIIKSSLTFVIDDTWSMTQEIEQVKAQANIILDKVLSTNTSQIENFVLVTFNDPTNKLWTVTKDGNELRRALSGVHTWSENNHDCPELSMAGIELGLTQSLPLSYLYVFTDASAKDYARLEQVKSLALKKQSQVTFILTGECGRWLGGLGVDGPDHQAYNILAEATSGQVFHMFRGDVKDILKYVEETITGRGISLVNKKLAPGYDKTLTYPVDSHTGDVLISVTGMEPKIRDVTGPGGSKPTTEPIVSGKQRMAVVKVKNAITGDHEVKLGSKSDTHVMITAKSDLNFQPGFSVYRPASINDTVTRPPPDGNAFLGIKLLGSGVKLTTAKILDMSDNVITELSLELVDEKAQFYLTPSFNAPFTLFRVSINGLDVETKSPISPIMSPTPVQRQDLSTEPKVNTAPEITIEGAPKIIAEYGAPLQLKCIVHAYPAPDITWQEKDTADSLSAKVQLKEVPYDYVGILDIDKVNKNAIYQCKGSNFMGVNIKFIEVEIKTFFDVIEPPKDIHVEYDKEGSLVCKVDAYPPASITWYKDGVVFSGDSNSAISGDKSLLTIQHMQPGSQGTYMCEARNDIDRKVFTVKATIFGVEKPVIDKSHKEIRVPEMTSAELSCRILKGIPKPNIAWSYRAAGESTFSDMTDTTETIRLSYVRKEQTGSYKCTALNELGTDSFTTELVVEYPPNIIDDVKLIRSRIHNDVRISCDVTGVPTPTVRWYFNSAELNDAKRESSDHSLNFQATPVDIGSYTCQAINSQGSASKTVILDVLEKPVIDKSVKNVRATEKTTTLLTCRILQGNPKPKITWSYRAAGESTFSDMTYTTETIRLSYVRKEQTGSYKCTALNELGTDSFTTELVVEYPPNIIDDVKLIRSRVHNDVRISCDVTGVPTPTVRWYFNSAELNDAKRESSDHSLSFKATPVDIGSYTCQAINSQGSASKTVMLDVLEKPVIGKFVRKVRTTEKRPTSLTCRILQGNPKPKITWSYRAAGESTFSDMTYTTETIRLRYVRKEQTGSYKCTALNELGTDSSITELVVQYKPIIKEDANKVECIDGDEVRIPCDVTGEPAPVVNWYYRRLSQRKFKWLPTKKNYDFSLRFKARIADAGAYKCEAKNKLGTAKRVTFLYVYIPVTIEPPKMSTIETMVGKSIILNCRADGYPKPSIEWTFHSLDPKIPAKDITPSGEAAAVSLKNIQLNQEGLYTCVAATDIGGSAKITYDVKVRAPPVITNTYTRKHFDVLEGDLALKIRCNATGSPKPSIVWTKYRRSSFKGTEWHEVEDDGTLVIKNIDRESAGTYVCLAQNVMGKDTVVYEVTVRELCPCSTSSTPSPTRGSNGCNGYNFTILDCPSYDSPTPAWPTSTVSVEEGKSINIPCGVLHKSTDQLRWYKNGVTIAAEKLTLYSVTRSDDGLYTCRVSGPDKSYSGATKVVVGFKPEFITDEPDIVQFVLGADSEFLSCEAYGEPRPKAAWKHNGEPLSTTSMTHPLDMVLGATGTYECEVSNKYGSIHRTFKVTSRDCILDIKKDFPEKQPIMYSRSLGWPVFPVKDGYMIIPHQDYFFFNCSSLFTDDNLPYTSYIIVFCERDNKVKINGHIYNFADIKCISEAEPDVSRTGIPCLGRNTEYINIGYRILNTLLEVYDVCLDKKKNVTLFTKHKLSSDYTDRTSEAKWSNSLLPQDLDSLYDCRRQAYDIAGSLGRGLRDYSCCFGRRQLVSARDLLPGVPTSAVYDYLNVVPHWSSCNTKNWEEVEDRVRKLVKVVGHDLIISTGTASPGRGAPDILLQDGRGGNQPTAHYLWKVVQDPIGESSLAIVQVNVPEVSRAQAPAHVLCPNICGDDTIAWMENSNWDNVDDGFTYCCSIQEFETAFGYRGRFSRGMKHVLRI